MRWFCCKDAEKARVIGRWKTEAADQAAIWNRLAIKAAWARMLRPPSFGICPFWTIATAS